METPNVSMKPNSSLITMNLTFFSTPKERVDAYGDGWQKASLSDTLQKFGVKTSHFNNMKSKIVYETNIPNVNVCYDFNGDYFTIEDLTKGEQPRRYLDINAEEIPNNYTDENGKQHGLSKAEYRKITHFLNSDD